jgi:hypothetical protein
MFSFRKGKGTDVNSDDILQFFDLLLLSGYHSVPSEDMYWSSEEDTSIPIVSTVMPRNRFRKMKNNFHLIDNIEF